MSPVRFDAPWDLGLKVATITVLVLVAIVFAASATRDFHGIPSALIAVPVLTTPLLLLLVAFLGAPRAYTIDANAIVIEQWSGRVTIPLATLREVRELGPQVRLHRVMGVGGFFGYWGDYHSAELGRVRLLATRSDGRVLLRGDAEVCVVTPAEPARFVALVHERLGRHLDGPMAACSVRRPIQPGREGGSAPRARRVGEAAGVEQLAKQGQGGATAVIRSRGGPGSRARSTRGNPAWRSSSWTSFHPGSRWLRRTARRTA